MLIIVLSMAGCTAARTPKEASGSKFYDPGRMKPIDSELKVKTGQLAPDFTLRSTSGEEVTLSRYRGQKNVVISFVPAAWRKSTGCCALTE